MPLVKEQKDTIIVDFRTHDVDTGSSEVQIALLSARISYLTEHFKTHKRIIILDAACSSSWGGDAAYSII